MHRHRHESQRQCRLIHADVLDAVRDEERDARPAREALLLQRVPPPTYALFDFTPGIADPNTPFGIVLSIRFGVGRCPHPGG